MKIQALLVLSLAYAASAQYNYYARPLSATGYDQQVIPMATPAPVTESYKSYAPMMSSPPMATPERQLTREENPCSEEVLRSPEIQAFKDPQDRTSYIVCTEIDIFVRMPCATGTFFDETIRHCVPDGWVAPICPVGLCKNSADCIIDELKNEYKCLCRVGFTGIFCETNIDECALEGNALCMKHGGQCVDQLNAYYCDFGDKIGLAPSTAIEKPCTLTQLAEGKQFFAIESPLNNFWLQCLGENKWLVSKCAEMLFWDQELRTCTIEQPIKKTGVCNTYPCKNDGSCEDLGNFNFQCTCKEGYTGALCEEVIDFCLPMPCGSGRCVSHPGGHNCVCKDLVVDQSCDNGNTNPCVKPYDYLPNMLDSSKYYVCGLEGLAFVKTCAEGTFWSTELKTCIAPERITPINKAPKMSIFDSYMKPQQTAPIMTQTYEQAYTTPMMTTTTTTTTTQAYKQAYETVRPQMQMPMATPAPVFQSYEAPRPQMKMPMATPAPIVQTYEAPRPQMQMPMATPAPMVQTYEAPRPQMQMPMATPAPMVQTYEAPRPQMNMPMATPAPVAQTYSAPRPQMQMPMATPAPVSQSYGQRPRMPSVPKY